jgi:hypothetical protein
VEAKRAYQFEEVTARLGGLGPVELEGNVALGGEVGCQWGAGRSERVKLSLPE